MSVRLIHAKHYEISKLHDKIIGPWPYAVIGCLVGLSNLCEGKLWGKISFL